MHIHIVCARPQADRILPRLARYLRDINGWTLGEHPLHSADANFFIPYIQWAQNFRGWHHTPVGAFFTHKDTSNPKKLAWWEEAAKAVDLRIAMTTKYLAELKHYGKTFLVRPPVEQDRFTLSEKDWGPVVGVSGFVYNDRRKGEDLVLRLSREADTIPAEFVASGRGWALDTDGYPWGKMPEFYQGLDILLCPSRIEGGPMSVPEAMATGARVVIPEHVGFCDDIPDTEDVYRFKAGNYHSMRAALLKAIEDGPPIDRQRQRRAVSQYTVKRWARGCDIAFIDLLYSAPRAAPQNPWRGHAGIYVVAFGAPARRCARRCLKAVRENSPNIPVALASTKPLGLEDVFIEREDIDIGARLSKLSVYDLAPPEWEYVLYLDADTEPVEPLYPLFDLLAQGWEALICKDMGKYAVARMMKRPDNRVEFEETMALMGADELMQYNGGLFGFRRCERVKKFFDLWLTEWDKYAGRDQGALLRALYQNPLRLYLLPNYWNASTRYPIPFDEVAVYHHNMEARRHSGLIFGRTDSDKAWEAVQEWQDKHGDKSPGEVGR